MEYSQQFKWKADREALAAEVDAAEAAAVIALGGPVRRKGQLFLRGRRDFEITWGPAE